MGPADGNTWDSVQLRLIYEYDSGREAAFDIHTSWVTPDNFPGYVEQEVQFRFDNGVWNGHSRKRGVEVTVENLTPIRMKNTINNHYNAMFVEPWGERTQRGYGIEVIDRFAREVAFVEHGGSAAERDDRLQSVRSLQYADLAADRQIVAAVQAMEMILEQQAAGCPDCVVRYDGQQLQLLKPTSTTLGWNISPPLCQRRGQTAFYGVFSRTECGPAVGILSALVKYGQDATLSRITGVFRKRGKCIRQKPATLCHARLCDIRFRAADWLQQLDRGAEWRLELRDAGRGVQEVTPGVAKLSSSAVER